MICMKNRRFSSCPGAKARRQGPPGSARAQPCDTFQFVDLCNKNSTNLHCNLHEVQSSEQQFPASVGHSRQEGKENERPLLSSETLFCITADHICTRNLLVFKTTFV